MSDGKQIDLAAIRSRVARLEGPPIWRSLEELADSAAFKEATAGEFPGEWAENGFSRRNFMKLMGASLALAGVYGCSSRPSGKILPYVNPPEQVVPGKPLFFATAIPFQGHALGALVESHEGRPTKIEGNPDHPGSLGAANVFMQASVLQLYDPERAKSVMRSGVVVSWSQFGDELDRQLVGKKAVQGDGVRILTETVTSPTLAWQIGQFLDRYPKARWHVYDPTGRYHTHAGAPQVNGRPASAIYTFYDNGKKGGEAVVAKTIVSLDSNFLFEEPGSLNYARGFADTRRIRVKGEEKREMSRLWVFESALTITGSMADHRYTVKPSQVRAIAYALAAKVGAGQGGGESLGAEVDKAINVLAAELQKNKGAGLVIAGEGQPPEVHALAHAMNQALGNVGDGKPVRYIESPEFWPVDDQGKPEFDGNASLRQLTDDMNAGKVDTLLIIGGNPVYTAPADIPFQAALARMSAAVQSNAGQKALQGRTYYPFATFTAYLGMYGAENDETAHLCQWSLPEAHHLEAWGDARAFDGTACVIQPLIGPMREGRSAIEVMDMMLANPGGYRSYRPGYEIVRGYWQQQHKNDSDFENWWARALERGVIDGTAFKTVQATPAPNPPATNSAASAGGIEVVFRPDSTIWDGRYCNNGWLQELPKQLTKLVWDNAAYISPATASRLGTSDGGILLVKHGGYEVRAPAMILPGQPDDVVTLTFGYGRTEPMLPPRNEDERKQREKEGPRGIGGTTATEPDGTPRGYNAYLVRTSNSPGFATGVELVKTSGYHHLVTTRNHHAMEELPAYGRKDTKGNLAPGAVATPEVDEDDLEIRNRRIVRLTTLQFFEKNEEVIKEMGDPSEKRTLLSIYPDRWDYSKGYQWGMSIDQQTCIGCNACVTACQAENNIAVVGRDEVARQREMHWIRIDSYFIGSLDGPTEPKIVHQPIPCMQCEVAPCELVCPVGATSHSVEGINEMTYNRCVGTRYCSNNCPYKVRRFNFFNWFGEGDPSFDLQHNPDVTVRVRGVMEKCNYCLQRVNRTRIEIEKMVVRLETPLQQVRTRLDAIETQLQRTRDEGKKQQLQQEQRELNQRMATLRQQIDPQIARAQKATLEDLQTACQQACPTEAIVFGNKNDPDSHVSRLKSEPLNYPLLSELTTVPRTTYMARLRNPSPDLEPGAKV